MRSAFAGKTTKPYLVLVSMGITYSSVVAAPIDAVFEWHERRGALVRLLPPWQPLRVIRESDSVRDGMAVLALPGRARIVARHDYRRYQRPTRFSDMITSFPLQGHWKHEHAFSAQTPDTTRLTDKVDAPVPARLLQPMFTYRHRQLAHDLNAHSWASTLQPEPLTVALAGASGMIGTSLAAFLTTGGHRVIRLVRHASRGMNERRWDPHSPRLDLLDGVDAVIHLAGAPIAKRFTAEHRRAVADSRVGPTRELAKCAAHSQVATFISASAVGFYGPDRGDEQLYESSPVGDGFLADVVARWEEATQPARAEGVRTVQVRTGIVQTPRGGFLQLQRPLFMAGGGGKLGSGDEWLPWIGLDDLLDVYLRALVDPALVGPVNAVAPNPVRTGQYAATLGRVMRRPALIPVPGFGPRLLLGAKGAREVVETSQYVVPDVLERRGHKFRYERLEDALRHELGKEKPVSGSEELNTGQ